jgi:hypothetical protein
MIGNAMKRTGLAAATAFAALVFASSGALAAGTFDGTWVLDFPAAGYIEGTTGDVCPALRLPMQIENGHVVGSLVETPTIYGGVMVEPGTGPASAPVSGSVGPNGALQAQWSDYRAIGQLGATGGQVTVNGECGPRVAQAYRVSGLPHVAEAGGAGN